MLVLFTDYGVCSPYVGQLKAALLQRAPGVPIVDAQHDVPAFDVVAAAHLLAASAAQYPRGSVFLAVIDPGVGGARGAIALEADGRRFVGPDNGLLSVLWQRARRRRCERIAWRPARLSSSFHGRDLFAPVAAALAVGRVPRGWLVPSRVPEVQLDAADLGEIIYVDAFGNAMSGLRAAHIPAGAALRVAGRTLPRARTFETVPLGEPFWYANSMGLVEVAANRASAARMLRLRVGSTLKLTRAPRRAGSRGSR